MSPDQESYLDRERRKNEEEDRKRYYSGIKDAVESQPDVVIDEGNLGDVPGSKEGGTLAGTPGYLGGGHEGRDPAYPQHVPPYGTVQAIPMGTDEGAIGTTTGDVPEGETGEPVTDSAAENEVGSTLHGNPGSMTGHRRKLRPGDLRKNEKD